MSSPTPETGLRSVSVYLWSVAAKNMFFPYSASIKSILPLADEICIAYDPEFEDFSIYAEISDKIKGIIRKFDVTEWDIRNKMLQAARSQCTGEWCIHWHLGSVLHEKDVDNLKSLLAGDAYVGDDYDTVCLGEIFCGTGGLARIYHVKEGGFKRITKNLPYLQNKTPDNMIGIINSDIWGGKYLRMGDDAALCNTNINDWFMGASRPYFTDSIMTYYYVSYNWNRKQAQYTAELEYINRVYGRSSTFDITKYYENLKTPLKFEKSNPAHNVDWGFKPAHINHSKYIRDWMKMMDEWEGGL